MSRRVKGLDKAVSESFFSKLKRENIKKDLQNKAGGQV
jgi:hypothetical protein